MAEGEAEAPPEEEKKGSKKKLIIMGVVLLIIGYEVASMTVLKPPPPTPAQKAAKEATAKTALQAKCARANGLQPPPPVTDKAAPTTTTVAGSTTTTVAAAASDKLQVLTLDSVTINLADGHFLKVGLGLQLPAGVVADTFKTDGTGAAALNFVLTQLRTKTTADLGPKDLEPLREKLGYQICASDGSGAYSAMNYAGGILTIFFSDFVTQ